MGGNHQGWYDKPVMHEAVRTLYSYIKPLGLMLPEVSLRWLAYHSALGEGDGIILGGSKISQLAGNLEGIAKGPLPEGVVEAIENMWRTVKTEAP